MGSTPREYAIFIWDGNDENMERVVRFTHRQDWSPIGGGEYMQTLRELGDEGFEIVSHQFLKKGQFDRGGLYGELIRELLTLQRPLED